jgi:hypothetical protein
MGYSATVFLANLYCLPDREEEILTLPREAFDTADEVFAAAGGSIEPPARPPFVHSC